MFDLHGKNYGFTLLPTYQPIAEDNCVAVASKTRKNILITMQVRLLHYVKPMLILVCKLLHFCRRFVCGSAIILLLSTLTASPEHVGATSSCETITCPLKADVLSKCGLCLML